VNANADLLDALVERIATVTAEKVKAELVQVPEQSPEPWRLLTAKEAGQLLGRSERWVYAASQVGSETYLRLPYVLVGERKMFDPAALRRWAEERQTPAD
jgi:hypothetical protein